MRRVFGLGEERSEGYTHIVDIIGHCSGLTARQVTQLLYRVRRNGMQPFDRCRKAFSFDFDMRCGMPIRDTDIFRCGRGALSLIMASSRSERPSVT